MNENEEIINEFLTESFENLDRLDQDLVKLEQSPGETGLLDSIFRTIHTIKGTCGFLGFTKLESVTHAGENLLSKLRDGALALTPSITTALLMMVDSVRQILSKIERDGCEGDEDYSDLTEKLTRLQEEKETPAPSEATATDPAVNRKEEKPQSVGETSIRVDVDLLDRLMNLVGELVLARNQILQFNPSERDVAFLGTTQHLNLVTTELQEGVMKTRMQPIGNIWGKFPRVVRDLAVSCGKKVRLEMEGRETELDKTLIEAIKDPLTHIVRNSVDHGIEPPEVRKKSGKPEEGVLFLRAYHEGGQVNIEIIDDGAGIDPEKIKKNAINKNLITPDQAQRMTDREAVLLIFAPGFSTAEQVSNVSGRGVGMDVVRTNIEKIGGTIDIQSHPGQGTTLKVKIPLTLAIIPALIVTCGGDRYAIPQVNLLELVLLEGEAARNRVETIQGSPVYRLRGNLLPLVYLKDELKVQAEEGQGSLNIVVLQADVRQFGLVVDSISDTEEIVVKPLGRQFKDVTVFAGATIMGDGKVALILDVMGLAQRARVVTEARDRVLTERLETTDHASGVKQTLLILAIGAHHTSAAQTPERNPASPEKTEPGNGESATPPAVGRMAIPLSLVARLEEFKKSEIEHSGNQSVVQYRGEIMPLIGLEGFFDKNRSMTNELFSEDQETIQAVVYTRQEKSVGLVVNQILDIVEERITVQREAARRGIMGTVVVQNRVTDLVDVEGIVREADPTFFEEPVSHALAEKE